MSPLDLRQLSAELLDRASRGSAHRATSTLPHPVDGLRQTLIALLAGAELGEHESPGPASLYVLQGRVRVLTGEETAEIGMQEVSPLPDRPHSLQADEDSVVLLSVAVPQPAPEDDGGGLAPHRNVAG
jgi:quercetin dioxygenase-like cupin family protein